MKELNKRFITGIIIVGVAMGFLFCKTDYIISFIESSCEKREK